MPAPAWSSGFDRFSVERLLDVAEPYWPDAARFREMVRRFPSRREQVRRQLLLQVRVLGLDPEDLFHPHPTPEALGSEGILVGDVVTGRGRFFLDPEDLKTGVLLIGSPKSGKSTGVCHLIEQAWRLGIGALVFDLRGDYRPLAERIPGALYVPWGEDRFNPLEPPSGVPLRKWLHTVSARFTLDLGLQGASQSYLISLFGQLCDAAEQAGVAPTVNDLYELLRTQKPRFRSSEEGYQERVLARVRALLEVAGEETFAVQKGFPVTEAVEAGRVVVLDLRTDKMLSDFFASTRINALYYKRLHSADPFHNTCVLIVLDEQRNLIRAQRPDAGIPDFHLLASRSRALGIGLLVAEQIPSEVSPAILTACRLKLCFNTSPPEQWVAARLIGASQEQAGEIVTLAPGECIVRFGGDRLPHPFKLKIPF